jgi:hypothetical protein
MPSSRFIDGPRLTVAERGAAWHGLTWLPQQPQVTEEECELFVECAVDPALAAADGIPSAHLFLLAHLDVLGLAARTRQAYLLVLRVGPGGAVDVGASEVVPPPALADALRTRDVYVLPAGWLDRCRIVGGLQVARGGRLEVPKGFPDLPVTLLSRGAAHGVPGLPNEVARWPSARLRTAYLLVAENDPGSGLGAWQRLYLRRPPATDGLRLLMIGVERERAIDIAATAAALAALVPVRTILSNLLAAGAHHVLPVASYSYTTVQSEYRADRGRWRQAGLVGHPTLDRWHPAPR